MDTQLRMLHALRDPDCMKDRIKEIDTVFGVVRVIVNRSLPPDMFYIVQDSKLSKLPELP